MIEHKEPMVTQRPKWFDVVEPEKRELWEITGKDKRFNFRIFGMGKKKIWRCLFTTAEEARAAAVGVSPSLWVWDGFPARVTTLGDVMLEVSQSREKGVMVKTFDHTTNTFVTIARYPADRPLRDEE